MLRNYLFYFFVFFILNSSFALNDNTIKKKFIIKSIETEGNRITREHIIQRELTFTIDDTLTLDILENSISQSKKNLLNTLLFNFVDISYAISDSIIVNQEIIYNTKINISFTERWYTWPIPLFMIEERNFNDWWETKSMEKLSYGIIIKRDNFRGRKEELSLVFKTGYNEQYGIKYEIPYINKSQTIGMGGTVSLKRNHSLPVTTENHNHFFLTIDDSYPIENIYFNYQLTHRKGIHNFHRYHIQYDEVTFSDTVFAINSDFINPIHNKYKYFTMSYYFKSDYRNFRSYPLTGYYFDCEIKKQGFDIIKNNSVSLLSITSNYRKFWELFPQLYYAVGLTGKLRMDSDRSYYFNRAMGFGRNYVRGYESYIIDGQNFFLLKSNFKYNIIPEKVINLNFIKTEKFNKIPYAFYINFFTDAGYVSDKYFADNNNLSNKWLWGYGIGLDFISYYDIVYRFEVSRNIENEFGFTIQFMAPI